MMNDDAGHRISIRHHQSLRFCQRERNFQVTSLRSDEKKKEHFFVTRKKKINKTVTSEQPLPLDPDQLITWLLALLAISTWLELFTV